MEIKVTFASGSEIIASINDFQIKTDQPQEDGGKNVAPSPYLLFLASLATCGGYYIMKYCRARNIDYSKIKLSLRFVNISKMQEEGESPIFEYEISLYENFDEKVIEGLKRAVLSCAVKKTIEKNPKFDVIVKRASY